MPRISEAEVWSGSEARFIFEYEPNASFPNWLWTDQKEVEVDPQGLDLSPAWKVGQLRVIPG